jgi:oligopeptide transport system ATP-binding protein
MTSTSYAASTQPRSADAALLSVRGLSKRFPVERDLFGRPTKWLSAVDEVDLDIYAGETVALVGESGSGKSTLGRLVLRLIDATAGSVYFEGMDLFHCSSSALSEFRRKAQIVSQDPFSSLDPRMKVYAIVSEGMGHLGLSKRESINRVASLLDLVHLPQEAMLRFPHEFSGGQRQRISIARALAVGPKFLVADEPVSALDVSVQSHVLNLLADLRRQLNLTYLFISHDTSVVENIADRVAVMYLGKIVEIAPTDQLFSDPRHPYTQALLSSVPSLVRNERIAERIVLEGEIPNAVDLAPGCRFASRCFRALDRCHREVPPLEEISDGHRLACFNPATLDEVVNAGHPS